LHYWRKIWSEHARWITLYIYYLYIIIRACCLYYICSDIYIYISYILYDLINDVCKLQVYIVHVSIHYMDNYYARLYLSYFIFFHRTWKLVKIVLSKSPDGSSIIIILNIIHWFPIVRYHPITVPTIICAYGYSATEILRVDTYYIYI